MDDDKRVVNHFHLTDLGLGTYMVLVLLGLAVTTLILGVKNGEVIAIVIVTVLSVLILLGIGAGATLFIMSRAHKNEERRASIEQKRAMDNTRENLALLEQQARAQIAQSRVQDQQWKTTNRELDTMRKMLTAPEDNGADGFVFDETLFNELDDAE